MLGVPKDCLREARTLRASDRGLGKSTRRRHVPSLIEKEVVTSRCHGNKTKNQTNDVYTVFPVHDCTQEQNGSPYFFFHLSTMQMAVSVKIQKFCYHNNLTSHFSSLLRRAALLKIMQNTAAECWKTYTKMNPLLTFFVLAESTRVKWYKCLRL